MRPHRVVTAALLGSTAAAAVAVLAYWLDWGPQAFGSALGLALGLGGAALVHWAHRLMPDEDIVEERPHLPRPDEAASALETFEERGERVGRRRLLGRLGALAAVTIGAALLSPLRTLGPRRPESFARTSWGRGVRLVTPRGVPVHLDDLTPDSVVTVFPERHTDDPTAQAVLIRVAPGLLDPALEGDGVDGYVCYSKICTHAACPVGLYQPASHSLLCPCHQASFDVLDAARPVFGPAARALPRLPVGATQDGWLVALGDFDAPVGVEGWVRR